MRHLTPALTWGGTNARDAAMETLLMLLMIAAVFSLQVRWFNH